MTLPAVPDTFSWTDEPWGPVLRCAPLSAVAPTPLPPVNSVVAHRGRGGVAAAVGATVVAQVSQVHGRAVVAVAGRGRGGSWPRPWPEADVLVSRDPATAVAVRAADCVPLLMADPVTGRRGRGARRLARHGSRARPWPRCEALARSTAPRPDDLVVAIGPSIGSCCYEVGTELVDAFAAAGHERYLIDRWFLAPPPPRGSRERPGSGWTWPAPIATS